jgi:hypothetical protein
MPAGLLEQSYMILKQLYMLVTSGLQKIFETTNISQRIDLVQFSSLIMDTQSRSINEGRN